MTKRALVDLVRNNLFKIDQTSRYDYRVVENMIALIWASVLYEASRKGLIYLDHYAKEYTELTVTLDVVTNRYYSSYPVAIAQLPDLAEGIRYIATTQGMDLDFAPCSERDMRLSEGLEVDQVDSTIYYIPRYDRVVYKGMTAAIAAVGVNMTIVPSFEVYADTDELAVPGGQSQVLYDLVIERLLKVPPRNLINDNADV